MLKKANLDHILSNYRPVSNLSFISKLAEKASLISFTKHMDTFSLLPPYQSAYRSNYSTETLLVKLYNDVLHNMENQLLTPLVAIDLSAAFDTVDHSLLIDILENCFGVCGVARDWIVSYLADRQFDVVINDSRSSPIDINFSVPQGSINGPIYFTCYASTLSHVVGDPLKLVGYADDHNIYGSFKAGDPESEKGTLTALQVTLGNVNAWMQENRLKMNNSKSEFIIFGSNRSLPKCTTQDIDVANTVVVRSKCVKLLGVLLDENLTFKRHIAAKARIAALAMYNIRKLRQYLDTSTCLKLANALVFAHMDYCNSLFVNLPKSTLAPLQRIQNLTAKIILNRSKYDSSTEALKELHILPVSVRSEFKMLVLVFKSLHGLAPSYLSDLLSSKVSRRSTRSTSTNALHIPFTRHSNFADRSFGVAGPRFWNALPDSLKDISDIRSFKAALKTHLYRRTFLTH